MDPTLTPGFQVQELTYLSGINHRLIGVNSLQPDVNIFGNRGSNLTFAVLTLNRSSLTIRLIESIIEHLPDFCGELLLGDNGSETKELENIYRYLERHSALNSRIIEFGQNLGIAKGRNTLNTFVRTDWICQLDNDMYFISNPVDKIEADLEKLGCHFINIPVMNKNNNEAFLYGGNLYVEYLYNKLSIGGGTGYYSPKIAQFEEHEPFLCTFLCGGASIFNKHTFFSCGGYDERMFVGFEDTDFSIRLFQKGYKVAAAGKPALIHDHPKPVHDTDITYERERFSNKKLYESAKIFEQKHGFQVWNPFLENWIAEKLHSLLGEEKAKNSSLVANINKKPVVSLVVDVPDWALDRIAKQIVKNCSDSFDFNILYLSELNNLYQVFLLSKESQIIHFLWRSWLSSLYGNACRTYAEKLSYDPIEFESKYIKEKIVTTSVYDHLFLDGESFEVSAKLFTEPDSPIKGYTVSSEILENIYSADTRIKMKPSMTITDGVDLNMFCPKKEKVFPKPGEKLRVGWAGNSLWAYEQEDFKGVHTILIPAITELQERGYQIELILLDSSKKKTPFTKMPDFYQNIDVYVCTSKIEGTPNPILEAMASGVPFISTPVGIVRNVAGEKQSSYIMQERSIEELIRKLIKLLENPHILKELSEENLESIKPWSWNLKAPKFADFWKLLLATKEQQ